MTWETMSKNERNAFFAARLFGYSWRVHDDGMRFLAPPEPYFKRYPIAKETEPLDDSSYALIAESTTDPAAALGLLEEMRRRDYDYMIMAEPKGVEDNEFMVDLRKLHDGEPVDRHEGNADTLPAAICECVFRALADCPAAAQGEE